MNVPTCEYSKEQGVVKELALVKGRFSVFLLPMRLFPYPLISVSDCLQLHCDTKNIAGTPPRVARGNTLFSREDRYDSAIILTKKAIFVKIEKKICSRGIMGSTILKLFCFCFCFCYPLMVYAQNHVGIILNGYEENCEITHKGKLYECEDRRELYIGDTVKKKPSVKSLKIKWAPYVKGAERGQTYLEVVATNPDALKGGALTNAVKQYVNDFVKAPAYGTAAAVTRDPRGTFADFATLHTEYALKIAYRNEALSVDVFDAKGQKVFEAQLKAGDEVFINPKKLNMTVGEKYTLTITSKTVKRVSTITLMDEVFQSELTKGFMDIEGEKASPLDTIIRKAAYLQLFSDAYPDKVDLYWLSNQLLEENTAEPTKDWNEIVERLRERYSIHFRKVE